MSASNQMSRDEVGAAIAQRAWKDEAFRKAVLADPNKVYEETYGEPLPGGVRAKVLEDTATTVHFVIPAKPANAGELSDEELESVAGGFGRGAGNPAQTLSIRGPKIW